MKRYIVSGGQDKTFGIGWYCARDEAHAREQYVMEFIHLHMDEFPVSCEPDLIQCLDDLPEIKPFTVPTTIHADEITAALERIWS